MRWRHTAAISVAASWPRRAHRCPDCGGIAYEMGRSSKAPRRSDVEQWRKVQLSFAHGLRDRQAIRRSAEELLMDIVAGATALAAALYPRRWLLLSGAVVPSLSHGLAILTGSLSGMPVRWFDPPGSALLIIAFPCLAGFLCASLFHPDRGLLPRAARSRVAAVVAGGLVLLAAGPVGFVVWKLARSGPF